MIGFLLSEVKGGQGCEGLGGTQIPEWQVPEEMSIENDSPCPWSRLSTARNKLGAGPPAERWRETLEELHIEWAPAHRPWHGRVRGGRWGAATHPRQGQTTAGQLGRSLSALLRCHRRKHGLSREPALEEERRRNGFPHLCGGLCELATGEGPVLVSLQ